MFSFYSDGAIREDRERRTPRQRRMKLTKRERDRFANRLKRIEDKLAKKRDEIRSILDDLSGLVDSFTDGAESMDKVVTDLKRSREELIYATDRMSELV
jgi:predicted  nucleic acid-binding Zn-ribbon protein